MPNDYSERTEQLEELAFIDESADYEVDQTGIYRDPKTGKFALLTASGCSCWEGEFDEEQFDTLDQLEESLIADRRTYNPSLAGVNELMAEARKKLDGVE